MSNLVIEVTDKQACRKEVSVKTAAKEVSGLYKTMAKQYSAKASVPGFRAGKVPTSVVLKKYADEIKEQVRRQLLDKAIGNLQTEQKLDLANVVDIAEFEVANGKDADFTMTVDVYPTIELPDYKSLTLTGAEYKEDAAELEKSLQELAESKSTLAIVERAAEDEDFVKVDFKATTEVEGEDIQDYLSGEGRWFPIREEGLIPGVKENFIGKSAGDKVEWTATYAADFAQAPLAGKEVAYEATITEVHGRTTPEINDDLAKEMGTEGLEDLKTKIAEAAKGRFESEQKQAQRDQVIEQILASFECELPESIVAKEAHRQLHTLIHEEDLPHDCAHLDQVEGLDEVQQGKFDAAKTKANDKAARDIKLRVALRKVIDAEKISVGQDEVMQQIMQMSQMYRMTPTQLIDQLKESDSLNEFTEHVLFDKALDTIVTLSSK